MTQRFQASLLRIMAYGLIGLLILFNITYNVDLASTALLPGSRVLPPAVVVTPTIQISSSPSAKLTIDGVDIGNTPYSRRLAAGEIGTSHIVKLTQPGYREITATVVYKKAMNIFSYTLTPLPELGFDSGLMIRRAAYTDSTSADYFESCPDSPTGKCLGTIQPGGGFYNLSIDGGYKCLINASTCPYSFQWRTDPETRQPSAFIRMNTFNSPNPWWQYFGLQENVPAGIYGGIDWNNLQHTPKITDINEVHFKFRTRTCWTPFNSDNNRYGRYVYYLSWWNESLQKFQQVGINLQTFADVRDNITLPFTAVASTEAEMNSDICTGPNPDPRCDSLLKYITHINGAYFGIVNSTDSSLDVTPTCSERLSSKPWMTVHFKLQPILTQLIQMGKIDPAILAEARYNSGIITGTETWGHVLTEVEVTDHHLYGF